MDLRRGGERYELEAKLLCALGEMVHDALPVPFLVVFLPLVRILGALGEHRVDETGELVSGGGNGLGPVQASAHTPVVGAQGRLAGAQCGGRQLQSLRRTIGSALAGAGEKLAAGDLGAR